MLSGKVSGFVGQIDYYAEGQIKNRQKFAPFAEILLHLWTVWSDFRHTAQTRN